MPKITRTPQERAQATLLAAGAAHDRTLQRLGRAREDLAAAEAAEQIMAARVRYAAQHPALVEVDAAQLDQDEPCGTCGSTTYPPSGCEECMERRGESDTASNDDAV